MFWCLFGCWTILSACVAGQTWSPVWSPTGSMVLCKPFKGWLVVLVFHARLSLLLGESLTEEYQKACPGIPLSSFSLHSNNHHFNPHTLHLICLTLRRLWATMDQLKGLGHQNPAFSLCGSAWLSCDCWILSLMIPVLNTCAGASRGFAFVEFQNVSDAQRWMDQNQVQIKTHLLRVSCVLQASSYSAWRVAWGSQKPCHAVNWREGVREMCAFVSARPSVSPLLHNFSFLHTCSHTLNKEK